MDIDCLWNKLQKMTMPNYFNQNLTHNMHLKKITWSLLILLFWGSIQAQNFELGKVSIAELQEKEHPIDPTAPAAILFEKGKNYF